MAEAQSAQALTFHGTGFDLVEHQDGHRWLRSPQIADALGYGSGRQRIQQLYEQHAAEFTPSMTALVKLPTSGGVQEVRIFSLRGAHLLGMFARTARAAEFRRWVLDVLEHQAAPPVASLPPPVATEQVLATLQRVIGERDTLRSLLGKRILQEEPKLRKVIYYYGVPGLNNTERSMLMGWKTATPFLQALKKLAALGLVDYTPHPGRAASGHANKLQLRRPCSNRGGSPEQMASMRASRSRKTAAKRGGAA